MFGIGAGKSQRGLILGGLCTRGCAIYSVVTEGGEGEAQRSDQSTMNRAGVAGQPANHD